MSRPKHFWYGNIRHLIMNIERFASENSMQSAIFLNAMREADEETKKLPNGELRLKAVNDVLIAKTKTMEGVAQDVHYETRTVQGWINSYVNLVGKKAGY